MSEILKDILKTTKTLWYESSWFSAYCSGVILALSITLVYDILKLYFGVLGTFLSLAILIFITLLAIYANSLLQARRKKRAQIIIEDKRNPKQCRGLILLISSALPAKEAISYHTHKTDQLQYCWLVKTAQMEELAGKLAAEFGKNNLKIIPRHLNDQYDASSCYDLIKDIFKDEVPRFGLQTKDVMVDITGGTKPMSAAAMIAALEVGAPVEHVPTDFTQSPIVPLPPIEIGVSKTRSL